jgi:alpha-galactosidase
MKYLSVLMGLTCGISAALGASPDLTSPDLWKPDNVPFSFQYNGKPSSQFLSGWLSSNENTPTTSGHIRSYVYNDPNTELKVTAEVHTYDEFPTVVDWVLKFRNDGTADTPIIENILPLDWTMAASPGDCFIRHDKGSDMSVEDFAPLEEQFGPGGNDHIESGGERSSNLKSLPFFNLQTGDHGVIGAIGWTGGWKADFHSTPDGKIISMQAGMKATHLLLHPGEEIRTPRIVLIDWTGGDWQNSQNGWRRLILAHYTPQDDGKPVVGPVLVGNGWGAESIKTKLTFIQWIYDHQIPVNLFGIDAGWYGNTNGPDNDFDSWPKYRGDWFPSPEYYPNGIHPLGDALKAVGFGFICWIEPETCMPGTKIITEHPDWFLRDQNPRTYGIPAWSTMAIRKRSRGSPTWSQVSSPISASPGIGRTSTSRQTRIGPWPISPIASG